MSQSSEAGHDLVRDVEHVMPPADFPRLAVVILGRNHDAAGAQHRLGEEAGDIGRSDLQDLVLEFLHQAIAEGRLAHALRPAIDVGS